MSQIILSWLNDEIQLSKRITDFEEDFSNGFLLGQLLAKYNQQLNFTQFHNKEDKKSKINNFELLFDSFNSLGATFNSLVANDIINKKVGVAKKLLYELKMHLEKTNSNAFTKITKMTKTLSPLKKLKVSKQSYDKVDKQHFLKQLNQLHPAQKTLNQQKLLKKFSDFHDKQIDVNNQLSSKDYQNKQLQRKRFRQKQRDNLKKTADFRMQWQRNNVQKWQTNMTVRHIQNQKDDMFKNKLQSTKIQNKTMSELSAIKSLDKDIKEFERKFIKNSIKKKTVRQDSDQSSQDENNNLASAIQEPKLQKKQSRLATKLKFTSTLNQSGLGQSQQKKKPTAQMAEQQKHQRQKKRRKMIVEQNKRYQLIEISRRQKYILSTIQQTSKQQKQLEYEIWRVWQNKQIIKENKQLQEEKQKQKNQTKKINAKFKRDQLLKTYRQQHDEEVKDAVKRQQKLLKDKKVSDRKGTYGECKSIIEQFIQVSEKCFLYQQQTNQSQISQNLIDHLFSQFVQSAQTNEEIVNLQLQNYIHGKGQWKLPVKRKTEDQPTDPTLQNALPEKATNNFALGNILRLLYENKFKYEENNKNQNQTEQEQNPSEYVFSLLGLEFSGKHLVAEALQNKHGFNIIQIEKLIFNKIQQYESIKDKVSEISQSTKSLVELAYKGENIPNDLIIQLIHQEILKNPKSVLLNFPTSYNQALQISKRLSGVQPADFVKNSPLQQKIQSLSKLVWPTPSKTIQRSIIQCGIDLALWLDINDETSYDRYLGRRQIEENIFHIKDDLANQVNQIQLLNKASPQIRKNYQRLADKSKLQEYFNQFGIQITKIEKLPVQKNTQFKSQQTGNQLNQKPTKIQIQKIQNSETEKKSSQNLVITKQVKKSWQVVDGHCSIEQLQKRVLNVLEQTMQMKKLKKLKEKQDNIMAQKALQKKKQIERLQEQTAQKCVLSNSQKVKQKLKQALGSVAWDETFVSQICSVWQGLEKSTTQSLTPVFSFLRTQQQQQQKYFSQTKRNFINLLKREDKKFSIVKQFQMNYNKFVEDNKQMISQDYTKDELHQRVDDLEEILFQIVQIKKQDAIEERKSSLESGWIESQLQQFYNCVRILIQSELNRYNGSEKIVTDFYSKKYGIAQPPTEENLSQIAYDTSLEMMTKQGTFPRLEKLISQAMRIFNKEEQFIEDKNKKGGKVPPAKKDDKKGGKKGEIQQIKQPTAQQLQMKKAVNIQKSIFRYRISIINEFSLRRLLSLTKQNQNLYKSLESYLQYTFDIENKCVFNLSKIFREKIEREEKISNQVQVDYVDVIQTQIIRNFQKQKPVILSAKEERRNNRFSIAKILSLIKTIKNQSQSDEKISTKRLNNIFRYLKTNQNEKEVLPLTWKCLTDDDFQTFITNLDQNCEGFIELQKVLVFVIMTNFQIPSSKQLQSYYNELSTYGTQHKIEKKKFVETHAWFDEEYLEQENVRPFKRNEQIKKIIFQVLKINQNGLQYVQGKKVVDNLSLHWNNKYQDASFSSHQNNLGRTYFDIAFKNE